MRIKSYFSATVEAAVSEARRELGPDAVLVSTRSAPPEAQHLGRYEVVFGSLQSAEQLRAFQCGDHEAQVPSRSTMMEELTDLRKQIEELCRSVYQTGGARPSRSAFLNRYLTMLVDNGVPSAQAKRVLEGAAQRIGEGNGDEMAPPDVARRAIAAELEQRISVTRINPDGSQQRTVLALTGPSGAGKTDTLAKIAVSEGFAKNRPVRLLTTDCERVAASSKLNCFATILGVPLQVCESPEILEAALRKKQDRELVLIDTAGYSPAEFPAAEDLGVLFRGLKEVRTALVLAATMKAGDMEAAVRRFSIFRPTEVLFTHLDETESFGSLWNTAAVSRLPISYFGTGQQIPEDIEAATPGKVSFLVLKEREAHEEKERVSNVA